jgi:hypothetical protein
MALDLARLLETLHPDEFALRHRVVAQLDASMIDEIAAADYGVDFDQHRQGITDLLADGQWPTQLDSGPGEVLQLIRWSRPEDPNLSSGPVGQRGQLMRLFAGMVLIRVQIPNGRPSDSLAAFVMSALELGPAIADDALRYLAWCRRHEPGNWQGDGEQRPFLTLGLLLLAAATGCEPATLDVLADLLLGEVETAVVEDGRGWQILVPAPLLGLRSWSQQFRMWCDLARRCLIDRATDTDHPLTQLGRAVCGDTDLSTSDIRQLFAAS